jgi:hypothetical protein
MNISLAGIREQQCLVIMWYDTGARNTGMLVVFKVIQKLRSDF